MSHDETHLPTTSYQLLSDNERRVVDEYLAYVVKNQKFLGEPIRFALNKTIPSEFVQRSRGILSRPLTRAALGEKIRELADDQELSPASVIREISVLARSNMADYVEGNDFGTFKVKDIKKIPREKMAAIKRLTINPTMMGDKVEIVLHDKIVPLVKAAELMGLVAPDKPPALEEYGKQQSQIGQSSDSVPEDEYRKLLETNSYDL